MRIEISKPRRVSVGQPSERYDEIEMAVAIVEAEEEDGWKINLSDAIELVMQGGEWRLGTIEECRACPYIRFEGKMSQAMLHIVGGAEPHWTQLYDHNPGIWYERGGDEEDAFYHRILIVRHTH